MLDLLQATCRSTTVVQISVYGRPGKRMCSVRTGVCRWPAVTMWRPIRQRGAGSAYLRSGHEPNVRLFSNPVDPVAYATSGAR
jgi:hypothetical protein